MRLLSVLNSTNIFTQCAHRFFFISVIDTGNSMTVWKKNRRKIRWCIKQHIIRLNDFMLRNNWTDDDYKLTNWLLTRIFRASIFLRMKHINYNLDRFIFLFLHSFLFCYLALTLVIYFDETNIKFRLNLDSACINFNSIISKVSNR